MKRQHPRFLLRQTLIAGLGGCALFACAPPDRAFNDKPETAVGGAAAGASNPASGATSTGGKSNIGGSSNGGVATSGGTSSSGGASAGGGASTNGGVATSGGSAASGGVSTLGGSSASPGGGSNTGGKASVGGSPSVGGAQSAGGQSLIGGTANVGGAITGAGGSIGSGGVAVGGSKATGGVGVGGATVGAGGALTSTGGQPLATGGAPSATGGVTATGGANPTGGSAATGGSAGNCVVTEAQEVSCNDGIDNDCDGLVDCPVVGGRYPEPGLAAAGDDVWVRVNAPLTTLKVQSLQCRSGKPSKVPSIAWGPCIVDPGDPARVFSMSATEAQLATNDGVTQFDVRFAYTNGVFSEPRSIVYYAHSSLADGVAMVPKLACPPKVSDDAYFAAVRADLVKTTSQAAFAATDVQFKNPFVTIQFAPPYWFGPFLGKTPLSSPEKINVLSLRHRFTLDASRQLLLVSRAYQSTHTGSCLAATTITHEYAPGRVRRHPEQYGNRCDAIVMNKAGAGFCLAASSTGTVSILDNHSSAIVAILQGFFQWPKAEATMWQKLFDDRPGRKTLQYFSDKCVAGDTACMTSHLKYLILPDNTDPYFTSP